MIPARTRAFSSLSCSTRLRRRTQKVDEGVMLDVSLLQPPEPGFVCRSCLTTNVVQWSCTAGLGFLIRRSGGLSIVIHPTCLVMCVTLRFATTWAAKRSRMSETDRQIDGRSMLCPATSAAVFLALCLCLLLWRAVCTLWVNASYFHASLHNLTHSVLLSKIVKADYQLDIKSSQDLFIFISAICSKCGTQ